ncbi:MAG: DUF4179 domain-containing protein [Christensenellales bacterium]
MDNRKLVELLQKTWPVPSQAFDARITRQVQILVREKTIMKKKMSALAICVILLLSLALFGAVAELIGINLFELFGKQDQRLSELAPQAVLKEVSPITVESPDLGKTTAGISNAYYDGQSLLVAFTIQNAQRTEVFTPTADELSAMEKDNNPPIIAISNPELEGPAIQWNAAVQEGRPFGYVSYAISASDHTLTDNGIDLPPSTDSLSEEQGALHIIREYESPLPEAAQNRDVLRILIRLHQTAYYRYFDGKDVYTASKYQELELITATIWRADAKTLKFKGDGVYMGKPIAITATASAAAAQVTLKMANATFPLLPEDAWYALYLRDENQTEFQALDGDSGGKDQMTFSFSGTGQVPESLEIQLRVDHESDVAIDKAYEERMYLTLEAAE